ncbi:MAG: acetyl-CoA C-acyltransferase [Gammaproteobacteria bacterium]|nr:acetyl-CoA C-acyltransferase [Gammaproteobacteria bacterium]
MNDDDVVIVSSARTPMGGFQGSLSAATGVDLGATAIRAAVERAGLPPETVDEVIMGCVLPAALRQAPARQAMRQAGLPDATGAVTINKVCGSGLKAAMFATDMLRAGSNGIMVAGGMESMTNAPYLLTRARSGQRMGHGEMLDSMFTDGLEDAETGRAMGTFAQETADAHQIGREEMDAFAVTSLERARRAQESGAFDAEIAPVTLKTRRGEETVSVDEQPAKADPAKIPTLKPAFRRDGTVTAANSSSISDGAAALVLATGRAARERGLVPLARVVGHATHSQLPAEFTLAPVGAISGLLGKLGWSADEVDLYEINEAFAMVTMLATRELGLDPERVNIHGGACALGHPIGASGARILVTLLAALEHTGGRRGIASLCIGGGEATALAVERIG